MLRDHRLTVGGLRARYAPLYYSLPQLGIIVVLLAGVWLVDGGSVTIGDVVRAMSLFSILTLPMEILGYLFQEMPRSVVAMDRIDGVIAEPTEPQSELGLEAGSSRRTDEIRRPVVVEFEAVGVAPRGRLDVLPHRPIRVGTRASGGRGGGTG